MTKIKYNLGGIGKGGEYKTVNLAEQADINHDIMDLSFFCKDNSVDEFFLSHTLEHVPVIKYSEFVLNMKKKLKKGGIIRIIQTDVGKVIKMWADGKIPFRVMRSPIFTPASRCDANILQQHQNMWSEEELIKDFQAFGMKVSSFDAGCWLYDIEDDILPSETRDFYGTPIPNLGVIAQKI